jgi:hypothetical protein
VERLNVTSFEYSLAVFRNFRLGWKSLPVTAVNVLLHWPLYSSLSRRIYF